MGAARWQRLVLVVLPVMLVAGLVALQRDEPAAEVDSSGRRQAVAEPTTTTALEVLIPDTTGAPSTLPPVTARQRVRAAAPPVPRAPAAPTGVGTVVTADTAGIWVVDVPSRGMRRLADFGPFDIAGDSVLVARGMSVWALPLAGGPPTLRYTLESFAGPAPGDTYTDGTRERISMIRASADGTALLAATAPLHDASGTMIGWNEGYRLVDPAGQTVSTAFNGGEADWSGDGSILVTYDYTGMRGLRRDGTSAWGPVPHASSTATGAHKMTVSHDGMTVVVEVDVPKPQRYRVSEGRWDAIDSLAGRIDMTGDGRMVGQPFPPASWTGRTQLGISTWDPASGAMGRVSSTGSLPDWGPDGRFIVHADAPLSGPNEGSRISYRVRGTDGAPLLAIQAGTGLRLPYADNGGFSSWSAPRWHADGAQLVLLAVPVGAAPTPT